MSPRHKEFDPDTALNNAMQLFWQNGYEATSIQDLVDHLGINRFSIYDTFGDKHTLFMAACERFGILMEEERISDLENAESGIKGIREFFRKVAGLDCKGMSPRGCLMTNSIAERASCWNPAVRSVMIAVRDLVTGTYRLCGLFGLSLKEKLQCTNICWYSRS